MSPRSRIGTRSHLFIEPSLLAKSMDDLIAINAVVDDIDPLAALEEVRDIAIDGAAPEGASDDDGVDALDGLGNVGGDQDQLEHGRARTATARLVLSHVRRRAAAKHAARQRRLEDCRSEQNIVVESFGFATTSSRQGLTRTSIDAAIWRPPRTSRRALQASLNLNDEQLSTIATTLVWRWITESSRVLRSLLATVLFCCSARIKWDETQQDVTLVDPQTNSASQKVVSIMVISSSLKSNFLDMAQPIMCPLLHVTRLTADCLFLGLQRSRAFFGEALPSLPVLAGWVIIVLNSDDASSNRRAIAHIAALAQGARQKVLVIPVRCLAHLCHRCCVPAVNGLGLAGPLYRAAHVLKLGSYWMPMTRALEAHIRKKLTIMHHAEPEARHMDIAGDLLELTTGDGLPDHLVQPHVRELRRQVRRHVRGDWAQERIAWFCDGSCNGDANMCEELAVGILLPLLIRLLFAAKVTIPVISRWWKVMPCARKIVLGCGCHKIFSCLAPPPSKCRRQAQDLVNRADHNDTFHAEHGYRIRATRQFFGAPSTIPKLIVYLRSVSCQQRIMAWLMKNDSHHGSQPTDAAAAHQYEHFFGQGPIAADVAHGVPQGGVRKSRAQIAVEMVTPQTSPVWQAFHAGCSMLNRANEELTWRLLWHFAGSGADSTFLIWQALLPMLARLKWKVMDKLSSWPFILLRSAASAAAQADVGRRWGAARRCCLGFGLWPLKAAFPDERDVYLPEFEAVVMELVNQLDFCIFDIECCHHQTRYNIDLGCGKGSHVSSLSIAHMAQRIAAFNEYLKQKPATAAKKGRPCKRTADEKQRFQGGFAYFVQEISGGSCSTSTEVKAGAAARAMSERWQSLSAQEREVYIRCAAANRLAAQQRISAANSGTQEWHGQSAWGIGGPTSPLNWNIAYAPEPKHPKQAKAWSQKLHQPIDDEVVIPETVRYDKICSDFGICQHAYRGCWAAVISLLERLHAVAKALPKSEVEECKILWLVYGSDADGLVTFAVVVMLAYRQLMPCRAVFLNFVPCDDEVSILEWLNTEAMTDLRFDLQADESGTPGLNFILDTELCAQMAQPHSTSPFDRLVIVKLQFRPVAIDRVEVLLSTCKV